MVESIPQKKSLAAMIVISHSQIQALLKVTKGVIMPTYHHYLVFSARKLLQLLKVLSNTNEFTLVKDLILVDIVTKALPSRLLFASMKEVIQEKGHILATNVKRLFYSHLTSNITKLTTTPEISLSHVLIVQSLLFIILS